MTSIRHRAGPNGWRRANILQFSGASLYSLQEIGMNWKFAFLAIGLTTGCASSGKTDNSTPAPNGDAAPWAARHLSTAEVPRAYVDAWNAAQNKSTCALVAFANTGLISNATPRTATFSGGWAVAYDRSDQRSAFGVAGTGSSATDQTYEFPNNRAWPDGSSVSYGPEGGTGPNQLAYLRINGQGCLYNVWSRLGRSHLEQLLSSIRFVDVAR